MDVRSEGFSGNDGFLVLGFPRTGRLDCLSPGSASEDFPIADSRPFAPRDSNLPGWGVGKVDWDKVISDVV